MSFGDVSRERRKTGERDVRSTLFAPQTERASLHQGRHRTSSVGAGLTLEGEVSHVVMLNALEQVRVCCRVSMFTVGFTDF